MDISWYRNKLKHVPKYDSPKWHRRVSGMSDNQVIAVYYKFKKDGLFDKKKSRGENLGEYYQMTIFDFIEES